MTSCTSPTGLLPTTAVSGRQRRWSDLKKNRKFLLLLSSVLLVAAIVTIAATASATRRPATSHAIVHATCATTRFPDLCRSAILSSASHLSSISSPRDVILASLNLTTTAVQRSVLHVQRMSSPAAAANCTLRQRTALGDCLDMFSESLDELRRTEAELKTVPEGSRCPRDLALELEILVSAAMTNQESCLDGFSHGDADRHLRETLLDELTNVMHMCSNALAMIKDLAAGTNGTADTASGRRMTLGFAVDEDGWPEWMKGEDRRRMAAEDVTADVVVAADGSGNYKTISEAVAAAPANSQKRYVIRIKAGTYKENVDVPKKKKNLMFVGDGRKSTVITGSRNVIDGSTTFKSATLAVVGDGFLARGLRIENTAGPSKHQAVALRVGSDLSAFYDCDILAYQDTLYTHSLRQFFRGCLVEGTVDFIFGNAAVVIQDSDIRPRRPNANQKNMVTASGREDPNEPTGIVIQGSRIVAAPDLASAPKGSFKTYLGRPWKQYARTVVMESVIGDVIDPVGWHEWDGNFALSTLYYGEYRNTGAGAGTANRVSWKGYKVITSASEAVQFTPGTFIGGSNWLAATGFPFSLGLAS